MVTNDQIEMRLIYFVFNYQQAWEQFEYVRLLLPTPPFHQAMHDDKRQVVLSPNVASTPPIYDDVG